jgi:hypothetical protein
MCGKTKRSSRFINEFIIVYIVDNRERTRAQTSYYHHLQYKPYTIHYTIVQNILYTLYTALHNTIRLHPTQPDLRDASL